MKTIAVIGYPSLREFKEDCLRALGEETSSPNIFVCGDKTYIGIFRYSDIVGRHFDDYIEYKPFDIRLVIETSGYRFLRDEVKRRCYEKN